FACGYGSRSVDTNEIPTENELRSDPMLGYLSTSGVDGSDWRVLVPFNHGGPDWSKGHVVVVHLDVSPLDGAIVVNSVGGAGHHIELLDSNGQNPVNQCPDWMCSDAFTPDSAIASFLPDGDGV